MSLQIKVALSPKAEALAQRLTNDPGVMQVIRKQMDQQNLATTGHIQRDYLRFSKAGPSVPDGLRFQTGRYFGSLRPSLSQISGYEVYSAIGTNIKSSSGVSYPAVHEFGADFPSRPTRSKNPHYAIKHPQTKAWSLPARAPIQRGIKDRLPEYSAGISSAIIDYFNP